MFSKPGKFSGVLGANNFQKRERLILTSTSCPLIFRWVKSPAKWSTTSYELDEDGVAIFGAGDKTDDENVWVCSRMTQLLDDCLLQLGVEVF